MIYLVFTEKNAFIFFISHSFFKPDLRVFLSYKNLNQDREYNYDISNPNYKIS